MIRNVLIFGIILGAIIAGNMVYMVDQVCSNPDMKTNDVVGYAAMVIVFSLTFFGIRNYRNKYLNGAISFGQAFKTGALIVLVASTIYVGVWLFYYYLFVPEFIDQYSAHVLRDATRSGATEAEVADKTKQMVQLKEMYKNPLYIIVMSFAEVLPIGLAVALVSSLALKKKPSRA
jgi:hypothetical protein